MEKLKDILDDFGWEKVQQGQLPSEIQSISESFVRTSHRWDLYALNGVFIATMDGEIIFELSGIKKNREGFYHRTAQIPQNTRVRVDNLPEFLDGFKHIHSFDNTFLYDNRMGTHFDGIGKRIEEAGELYLQ